MLPYLSAIEPRQEYFFCVFVDHSNKVFYFVSKVFSAEATYTISSIDYTLLEGNTPYGKRHISRTESVLLQDKHIRLTITFTGIFFVQVPDQFDAFFKPYNA